jgi:hypothetical protein
MRLRLVVAAGLIMIAPALAHDSWISSGGHRNAAGEWCCGESDCGIFVYGRIGEGPDGYEVDGAFRIGDGPGAFDVPVKETVPYSEAQPSPDGAFWRCRRPDGSRRCFFAPPHST